MADTFISGDERSLIAELRQDVQRAFEKLSPGDQFWRRAYVRAVFSYFEAYSFVIRSTTFVIRSTTGLLLSHKKMPPELIAKIALLGDTNFRPDQTGKLEDKGEQRIVFVNYFAFTLRTFAEAVGMVADDIDRFFGDNAFSQLQRAKKVRDRLMHPKKIADITVNDAEVLDVTNVYNWVGQFVEDIEDVRPRRSRKGAVVSKKRVRK